MKLIEKISKNTFAERITKNYSITVRIVCNAILLPLIFLCFIMMMICNLKEQFQLVLVFFICLIILTSLLLLIQHKERMRIIKNDPKLESIIIRKTNWYSYDTYDYAKFIAIMKKRITKSLRNKDGLVSKSLINMLITELKENTEQLTKKYITFGVILAFLINPFLTLYSGKFVAYTFTHTFYLALITNAIAIAGIIYLAFIITNSQNIYLGFTKGYFTRINLIEQLYDIKADRLLNSGKLVKRSTYEVSN